MKQAQIADKVGKSREYVANTLRILALSDEILNALSEGKISEGHTRPLLMLIDRKEEQLVLFKEIMTKKLTVREAESLARRVATEKIRNKDKYLDPAIIEMEKNFTESLGTRVRIEKHKEGGTVTIDFFNPDDLRALLEKLNNQNKGQISTTAAGTITTASTEVTGDVPTIAIDDRSVQEKQQEENEEIYSLKNFSL